MALKFKISKKEWEKLSDELKSEYNADGENYTLDVSGIEDTAALKRARDREKERADDFKKKLEDTENELEEVKAAGGKNSKDIATLEKNWQKKLEETSKEKDAKIEKLSNAAKKNLIDGTAEALAAKISTVPSLMAKSIKERLTVDFDGDEPTLKILDKNGKPSDMTVDQLKEEFVANKEYSSIIVGSRASGSGAGKDGLNKSNGGGAGSQNDNNGKPQLLSNMSGKELTEHMKAKKAAEQQT